MNEPNSHNKLEKKFLPAAVQISPGGEIYLWPKDAIKLVKECEKEKYQIYGIDGMWILEDGVRPDTGHDINFSSEYLDLKERLTKAGKLEELPDERDYYTSAETYKTTIEFIQKRAHLENLTFIICCDE